MDFSFFWGGQRHIILGTVCFQDGPGLTHHSMVWKLTHLHSTASNSAFWFVVMKQDKCAQSVKADDVTFWPYFLPLFPPSVVWGWRCVGRLTDQRAVYTPHSSTTRRSKQTLAHMETDKRSPEQLTHIYTHCVEESNLLWWRPYFLKNKHTHTYTLPHAHSWTTQWSSVVPLKHPATVEQSRAVGEEITGLDLHSATNLPTWLLAS